MIIAQCIMMSYSISLAGFHGSKYNIFIRLLRISKIFKVAGANFDDERHSPTDQMKMKKIVNFNILLKYENSGK